jgi:hypothetical protein
MGMNGKQCEHIYTSSHFHLAVFLQVRAPSQLDRLLGRQERTSGRRAERKSGWLLYCESVRSTFLRAPFEASSSRELFVTGIVPPPQSRSAIHIIKQDGRWVSCGIVAHHTSIRLDPIRGFLKEPLEGKTWRSCLGWNCRIPWNIFPVKYMIGSLDMIKKISRTLGQDEARPHPKNY